MDYHNLTGQEKMENKTKSNKKTQSHGDWKNLVQGFVSGMLAQASENVSQRMHVWTTQLKRRAIGSVLMLLGATYFLTGISDWANSIFGQNYVGFGYALVGLVVVAIGYLVSRK